MSFEEYQRRFYSETVDQSLQSFLARFTNGISPAVLLLAFSDWYSHLSMHPAKQIELLELMQHNIQQLASMKWNDHLKVSKDKRFAHESWQAYPYNFYGDYFMMMQSWWHTATTNVKGVSKHHEEVVNFTIRQILDMVSPSNSAVTNPEIQQAAIDQHGDNFIRGMQNFLDDMKRNQEGTPPPGAEKFIIGENVALTEGKVIYRNHLIELIQYTPATPGVFAEPVLITPAWIMKYYILDLTPKHSLVNYLVKKGHTVFMISWKNPTKKDRDLGMDDYLNLGIMSALDVISAVVPRKKIHLAGYCLGGTLSAIAAAKMARDNDERLKSLTLFAAQTDFAEPGELGLFIDDSQIAFLEAMMKEKGYLDTHQMAGAFQLLRSNDLIWSRLIHDYLLGNRKPMTDLMAWNADATRLPYRMHSEYLRNLFLNNQLAEAKYLVNGRPIALSDITVPVFVVATERDHVSPWHSVFKINLLTASDVTFTLTSGGHNVGIVSLPVKRNKRYYRKTTLKAKDRYIDADTWYSTTKPRPGSWWPAWNKWLDAHSSKELVAPPSMGKTEAGFAPIMDAPGSYVLQR